MALKAYLWKSLKSLHLHFVDQSKSQANPVSVFEGFGNKHRLLKGGAANSHCKGKCIISIAEAIFTNSIPQIPSKSVGSACNIVNSIYKHAEIMGPLPAGSKIIYEERSFTVFNMGGGHQKN